VSGFVVRDRPGESRYEILDAVDRVAGFTEYDLDQAANTITFVHTEVEPAYEGQGIGSKLAAGALDDVRGRGLRVIAVCPFIAGYIERTPEYADLLAPPA
jgi:predicted GNAT family acetyltransferase